MVVNAPTSNIISAAELTIGHILSLARHIPAAHARSATGEWKRSKYTGVELFEKTVGIIGLGRIGALITARLQALRHQGRRLRPLRHRAPRPQQLGVQLLTLDELLAQSRLHHHPHAEDARDHRHDRRRRSFAKMKPTAFIVNVARGGLIDEDALCTTRCRPATSPAPASTSSSASRRTDSPLLGLANVVVTPHLGASTDEAQEKAGVSVAKSGAPRARRRAGPGCRQRRRRSHRPVRAPRHPARREARPGLRRARRTPPSRASTSRCAASSPRYDVERAASSRRSRASSPTSSARTVSYVNAPLLAEQRGINVAPHHDAGERGLPQRHDPARRAQRRHARSRSSGTLTGTEADREDRRHQRLRRSRCRSRSTSS